MAKLKSKDIQKMTKEEKEKKLKELKMELVKSRASAAKGGSAKTREIKKIIARIITLNK
jgi:large subunit ribosomal protein L29